MYGLADHNAVVFTESFEAMDLFEAHGRARSRARRFQNLHKVELWEGPVCVLRMNRQA